MCAPLVSLTLDILPSFQASTLLADWFHLHNLIGMVRGNVQNHPPQPPHSNPTPSFSYAGHMTAKRAAIMLLKHHLMFFHLVKQHKGMLLTRTPLKSVTQETPIVVVNHWPNGTFPVCCILFRSTLQLHRLVFLSEIFL